MGIHTGKRDGNIAGIIYGILAYGLWGMLPLYWKLLKAVSPLETLAHRIAWSFLFMLLVAGIFKGWKRIRIVASDTKRMLLMFACGFIISANWYTYIYAVNSDHVIEASMGYFINPLVVVMLGVTVFKEVLSRWQLIAIILAGAGVIIITIHYGRLPWIALLLAGTFALYGLIKKIARVDSITGLTLETFIVMPVALLYIGSLEKNGNGVLGAMPLSTALLLAGTGIITAVPLLFYAKCVENTTFSMMGFLQYIAPSIKLMLGIFVFREYFSIIHFISFSFIWTALFIFTLANIGILRRRVYANP